MTANRALEHLERDALRARVEALLADGFRLALVAAHDDRDALRVVYLLTAGTPDRRVELSVHVPASDPTVPSLAGISYPAGRFEREMRDLFGIAADGHPDLRRLVAHQHWPEGWHPMRSGADAATRMHDEGEPYPFLAVEGPGVYEIPVGPVHAGLIEPGHFRFSVVGETILDMKPRLWFVHKGIERLFQGRDPASGVELAERISGDTAVGHNLAFCMAVEDAVGCEVSEAARLIRAALLELERLYNHVADIGALCNDVGYGIVHSHAMRIRERLLRLNRDVTGHRLLRGAITPGGAAVRRLPEADELTAIAVDVREIVAIALGNTVVRERFTGTSVLDARDARDLGTLGYVARASGVEFDARVAHPQCDLGPRFVVPAKDTGDVLARFLVRVEEFDVSIAVLCELLKRIRDPQPAAAVRSVTGARSGVGIVEGWRGSIVHRVELSENVLSRVKVVDPSFLNWPALPRALADTIVPDFPLTNKSFNLSYAGNDL